MTRKHIEVSNREILCLDESMVVEKFEEFQKFITLLLFLFFFLIFLFLGFQGSRVPIMVFPGFWLMYIFIFCIKIR